MLAAKTFALRMDAEVNQRYSRELCNPIDFRLASTALRCVLAQGISASWDRSLATRPPHFVDWCICEHGMA